MNSKNESSELFQGTNIIILACYTVFFVALLIESFLLHWEKWPFILIGFGVILCWYMYIRENASYEQRLWLCAIFIMGTFFYYGIHITSTFDLAILCAAFIFLFTVTCIAGLVNLCQITFYFTLLYGIIQMIREGMVFDALIITRIMLHAAMITVVAWFARTIIKNWNHILGQSREEVEELMDSTERLNDFLANVSHELRTPVNAIIGLTGICIDKEENKDVKKDMVAVRSAGHKVAEQIGDILDYSEIDRGNIVVNSEDYMLSSAMNDLMNDLREYKHENVELIIDIDPNIPAVMNSDVTKIKKIIKALISNGLKYTQNGGVYAKFSAEKHPYGVNFCIEVTDTGIGMTDEEIERVYDRYYQSDSGRSRAGSGLGLGLGIVSGFVSLLGGFMTIKSRVGAGTTVRVCLPQTVVDDSKCMSLKNPGEIRLGAFIRFDKFEKPMVREYYNSMAVNMVKGLGIQMHRCEDINDAKKMIEEQDITHMFIGQNEYLADRAYFEEIGRKIVIIAVGESEFALPEKTSLKYMEKPFYFFPVVSILNQGVKSGKVSEGRMHLNDIKALVVDDEPMNLIVAKSIFKRYGMEVDTVTSGQESVDICRQKLYDIIFMDHMMAGMDGVEAMKKIRADVVGLNKSVPMIALTANAMSSAKQMFLSEGFDGFVSKPIETDELERVLKKLIPKNAISYISDEEFSELENGTGPLPKAETAKTESNEEVLQFEPAADENKDDSAESEAVTEKAGGQISFKDGLKAVDIDMDIGLGYAAKDEEFYKSLLKQYASEMREKINNMSRFLGDKDWKNYEIIIHSVKSTSKMVGGTPLSEEALALEKAADNEDEKYIYAHHSEVMNKCRETSKQILRLLGIEEGDDSEEEVMEFNPDDQSDAAEAGKDDEDEVFEFAPAEEEEALEFAPAAEEEALEFAPAAEEEALEFAPAAEEEAMEFAPAEEEEAMEFTPAEEEEALEFTPAEEEETLEFAPAEEEEALEFNPVSEDQ